MRTRLVKESLGNILKPKSKEAIIKQLSNLSQDEKNEKLIESTKNNQLDIVKLLIENGANINVKDKYGYTPLMWVSKEGYLNIAKYLIETGADVNVENKWGNIALTIASWNNHNKIIDLLKKHGAKE